jgi:hypothetical protein
MKEDPDMNLLRSALLPLLAIASTLAVSAPALARGHAYGHYPVRHESGRWVHDHHGGRLGWWWVVGSSWRFFSRPYVVHEPRTVIVEQPPVTIVQAPPVPASAPVPAPVLYYCKSTGTYYPDTMTCPGGWSVVTASAPPSS